AHRDKCVTWMTDPALAQRLMHQQLALAWPRARDALARALNPLHTEIFKPWPQAYYWSVYQSEWATDVLFKTPAALAAVYPALVRHATLHFQSPDIMRFLGRKAHGNFTGELPPSFKARAQRANEHYLDALAAVEDSTPLHRLLDQVGCPTAYRGRRVRALRIGDPADLALLQAISRGEWAPAGFRNRDLRRLLCPTSCPAPPREARRLTAKVTRPLPLPRAPR